ncbi:hypothetical protein BAUCODRAFT_262194 [Baudoinia panamericana UAMH 10762]|uniref:Uncharacterized protein n=1 Tax=Baudoinia panamericana (strain UAMH 10762) TaxID=717646 RepID=M2MMW9_BAUPA|nr:uncharacterized protein BAUCODRAFT_262194 [Baudoinia panamericana UAMH 10762]EMC92788.1 hypothetical protein BAUCODRAFT_262194 [Baudoinia panamericana UAMH 10762]
MLYLTMSATYQQLKSALAQAHIIRQETDRLYIEAQANLQRSDNARKQASSASKELRARGNREQGRKWKFFTGTALTSATLIVGACSNRLRAHQKQLRAEVDIAYRVAEAAALQEDAALEEFEASWAAIKQGARDKRRSRSF